MSTLTVNQARKNLERANSVRLAMSEVRLELVAGAIAFAEAIEDERSSSHYVHRLLTAVKNVGDYRARRIMAEVGIRNERKRVRELTPRQRAALVVEIANAVEGYGDDLN